MDYEYELAVRLVLFAGTHARAHVGNASSLPGVSDKISTPTNT